MAKIILICGLVGAGKSTYSRQIETHLIEAEINIRWSRVQKRNSEKGQTYSLDVDREMFDFCENLYEHPDKEEEKNVKLFARIVKNSFYLSLPSNY